MSCFPAGDLGKSIKKPWKFDWLYHLDKLSPSDFIDYALNLN